MKILDAVKRIDFRVRFSEVGENNCIDISRIIQYIEDCNLFEEEDNGTGLDFLSSINSAWFVKSWQVYVKRYPEFNEHITVHTWDYKTEKSLFYRNGEIIDESGNRIVFASCPCVFMDIQNNRPCKIPSDIVKPLYPDEPLDMDYAPRKIAVPDHFQEFTPFTIRKTDIDYNKHVNNARYIAFAEEYLPENKAIRQVRVDYQAPASLHSKIYPKCCIANENLYYVKFCNENNKSYATIEFQLESPL